MHFFFDSGLIPFLLSVDVDSQCAECHRSTSGRGQTQRPKFNQCAHRSSMVRTIKLSSRLRAWESDNRNLGRRIRGYRQVVVPAMNES